MAEQVVRITESRTTQDGSVSHHEPRGGKPLPTYHQVWVGNDEDGWVELPRVTNVDLPLRQGELRKAVITVLLPQVDFEGGSYRS